MATTLGTESTVDELLCDLIRLECHAVGAYDAAIDGLANLTYQSTLTDFKWDHQRHIAELGERLAGMSRAPPTHGDMMRLLAKGMAPLAGVVDDKAVLEMLKMHEDGTDSAYERAVDVEAPLQVHRAFEHGRDDARHHRDWIIETLKTL